MGYELGGTVLSMESSSMKTHEIDDHCNQFKLQYEGVRESALMECDNLQ